MMDTLVLDKSYQPLSKISWQEAFTMIFSDRHVDVIDVYSDKEVRSASDSYPMPSIIRFVEKSVGRKFRKGEKFNRKNVWLRDKGCCQYCGIPTTMSSFTYDHVIPRSRGGKTTWVNIVVACIPCNQRKQNRTPEEARMRLRNKPEHPAYILGGDSKYNLVWKKGEPESWRDYLVSHEYWEGELQS